MDTIYDPLRRKAVTATPEEIVRQWFISVLLKDSKVPAHMMTSEMGLKYGSKQYRADILVYNRTGEPLMVVECKRPDVRLGPEVTGQAMRYDLVLNVRWVVVTNGTSTCVYHRNGERFEATGRLPQYEEMICQQ